MAPGFKNATEILGMANARKRVPVLISLAPEQFGTAPERERCPRLVLPSLPLLVVKSIYRPRFGLASNRTLAPFRS